MKFKRSVTTPNRTLHRISAAATEGAAALSGSELMEVVRASLDAGVTSETTLESAVALVLMVAARDRMDAENEAIARDLAATA